MYIKVTSQGQGNAGDIVGTCPICAKASTFDKLSNISDANLPQPGGHAWTGQRKCPNPECRALLFFVRPHNGPPFTFPRLRIDFDGNNLPADVKSSIAEAITCQSEGCYRAAALMVRRTLEELCENKQCQGANLAKRIEALRSNVVLPTELFDALDEIRLLGNDAAHVESKDYDTIGEEESAIAIELTKEILKGVYQMDALVSRLKRLKKADKGA